MDTAICYGSLLFKSCRQHKGLFLKQNTLQRDDCRQIMHPIPRADKERKEKGGRKKKLAHNDDGTIARPTNPFGSIESTRKASSDVPHVSLSDADNAVHFITTLTAKLPAHAVQRHATLIRTSCIVACGFREYGLCKFLH